MLPLVSICVPVYNVAPYIARCMHSLMQQTYGNIEFVFVDDCSTDDSVSLLQNVIAGYPDRAKQVRILHNDRNHGLAYTRRVSIEAAKGEWILCVDSDDYIEPVTVERMYAACTPDCEMVIGGYMDHNSSGSVVVDVSRTPKEDLLRAALEDQICRLSGKLIRRNLFNHPNTRFAPDGLNYLEDRFVLFCLCGVIRHISIVSEPFYHYVQHTDSVSFTKTDYHFRCLIQYWQFVDRYLNEHHLTDTYRALVERQKMEDKTHLLHFCPDVSVCRQYADIFPEAETQQPALNVTRGLRITRFLTHHHLWILLYFYKKYVKFSLLFA